MHGNVLVQAVGGVETWDAFPSPSGQVDPARCPGGSSTPGLCRNKLFFFFCGCCERVDLVLFCSVGFSPLFFVHEGNSSSIPTRRESGPLIRKLVSGARSSQAACAPGAPASSGLICSCILGCLFLCLGGTRYVTVKNFSRVFWFAYY